VNFEIFENGEGLFCQLSPEESVDIGSKDSIPMQQIKPLGFLTT